MSGGHHNPAHPAVGYNHNGGRDAAANVTTPHASDPADDMPEARNGVHKAPGIGATISGELSGADAPVAGGLRMAAGDFVGGKLAVAGKYGILTMHASGVYEYVQTRLMDAADVDEFRYTPTNGNGRRTGAVLVITAPDNGDPDIMLGPVTKHSVLLKADEQSFGAGSGNIGRHVPAQRGSLTIDSRGLKCALEISRNGQTISLNFKDYGSLDKDAGRSIRSACGLLSILGSTMDPATGLITVTYEYVRHTPCNSAENNGQSSKNEVFAVKLTGSSASPVELATDFADDAPVVRDNANILELQAGATVWRSDGNILADDFVGTNGPVTSGSLTVQGGNFDSRYGMAVIEGRYGTLVINREGQYSYALDQTKAHAALQTPGATIEKLRDEFGYSVTDDAGNISHAVLSLSLEKVQLAPRVQSGQHHPPALRRLRTVRRRPADAATGSRPAWI